MQPTFLLFILSIASANAAIQGKISQYHPNGGSSACGGTHENSELVATVDPFTFDNGFACGRQYRVNHQGKHVKVTVVGKCDTCGSSDIKIAPGAFKQLADVSKASIQGSWGTA